MIVPSHYSTSPRYGGVQADVTNNNLAVMKMIVAEQETEQNCTKVVTIVKADDTGERHV